MFLIYLLASDQSEIPLMYQSRAVKAWLKKTFYSGLYGLTHRLPWKEEVPAASFVAANSFVSSLTIFIT